MTGSPLAPRGDGAAELPVGTGDPNTGRRMVIAVVIALTVAAGGWIVRWAATRTDDVTQRTLGHKQVSAPLSFGSYVRLDDATTLHEVEGLRATLTNSKAQAAAFQDAVVGGYGPRGSRTPEAFLVANDVGNATVRELLTHTSSDAAVSTNLITGAGVPDAAEFSPGALGGSVHCGTANGTQPFTACVWADTSSFGMTIANSASAPGDLAAITRQLRAAAEI